MTSMIVILMILANIHYQEMIDGGLLVYHGDKATVQAGDYFWTEEHCNYRPPNDWMSFNQECHTDIMVMPHNAGHVALNEFERNLLEPNFED